MKKILFILNLALSTFILSAQDTTELVAVDTAILVEPTGVNPYLYNYTGISLNNPFNTTWREGAHNRITIDFDYFNNSNAAPANLTYAFLFKNEITNGMKDLTNSRIKKDLRYDDYMKTGLTYQHHFDKWNGTVILGYYHRQLRNISAPKEAFETVFYGNARFEGDTANFSNLNFSNNLYNQLSLGIHKQIDYGKYQMSLGIVGSFLQSFNHQEIRTNEAWIYTAQDADSLSINYDLSMNLGKEGATKFFELNGAGASVDFNLSFANKDKWKLAIDLFDVGYMTFRKNPVNYSGQKFVVFKGITLPSLIDFSPSTFDTLNLDSALRTNLPSKGTGKYSIFMPFTAHVAFSKPLMNNRLVLTVGLQYRHLPGYYAYGYAKVNYFIKPDIQFGASVGSGAYHLCNVGVEFSKSWKYFDLTLGTSNLLGVVAPMYFPGSSVFLRLGSSF
jgi:hypothetical protein